MDFFTAAAAQPAPPPVDSFADAIASRFDPNALLTARLSPPPSMAAAPPAAPVVPSSSFPHILPSQLDAVWLDDPTVLIVDIRPHAAFSSARIPRAVSLSVPSTLLKRPLFSLERLSAMLPSASARNRFSSWPSASRILVYDADSHSVGDSSNIAGLLRKFRSDGFKGDLAWLKGGFHAVWRESRQIVDQLPPSPEGDADEDDDKGPALRTRNLPTAAFSLSSTTVHNSPQFNSAAAAPSKRPSSLLPHIPAAPAVSANSHPAFNPFFDTIRQNTELSQGITERIPLRLPRRVRRRIHELPFPWLQDIARRAANAPPVHHPSSSSSESEDDSDGANFVDIEEGKEALAMQFFKVELSEQRRLMGIMSHHSKESGQSQDQPLIPFPFSITAGVEKGAKNRYRHIWPFEHARVRLHQKDDDYVNASYIQPLGTRRRYIATQGPLPATFTDFWTLCWEQNVHVIVMLTREVEGAMVKCGSYWTDTVFGPLRLRLVSTEGLPPEERPSTAGFFAQHSSLSAHSSRPPVRQFPHSAGGHRHHRHSHYHDRQHETVKRVFELTHTGHPDVKPRRIVHLQYLEWPDMNVPDDPRGVLGLIKQVDEAVLESQGDHEPKKRRERVDVTDVDEKTGIASHALENSPVLLHCSAGVGRTGGFIAVHAILDAIKKEIRNANGSKAMDVDKADGRRPTAPLTMSSGVERTDDDDAGVLAHVPLAVPMEVDGQPGSAGSDDQALAAFPSGTKQWAENVRQETGISGMRQASEPQDQQMQYDLVSASSDPPSSVQTPNSLVGSSPARHNGSYRYNSSSSLGTSLSGTSSSSSKANFPSWNTGPMTDHLLYSVLNNQQTAADQQRLRTISAPSANVGASVRAPMPFELALSPPKNNSMPRSLRSGGQDTAMATSKLRAFQLRSPVKDRGMSSDGESQAPAPSHTSQSADEAPLPTLPRAPSLNLPYLPKALSSPLTTTDLSPDQEQTTKTFDYKEPRPLHDDTTPPLLTSFDEPVWEVVQDMREQRMSLCQSLRQYVFIHAAIIEGALMVVDEERDSADGVALSPSSPSDRTRGPGRRASRPPPSPSHPHSHSRTRDDHNSSSSRSPSTSACTGKRAPSPTELRKEDKEGAVMLAKRPSMKRKGRSGGDVAAEVESARYFPVPPVRVVPSARAMPP